MKQPKITLAIPSNRGLNNQMAESAMKMIAYSKEYDWHIICPSEGYTIAENRNYIVVQALRNQSDYLLMIDDDMVFEPSLLEDLLLNEKDIISVAYHPRCDMGEKIKYLDETHYIKLEQNNDPKYKTTFETHATGTGIILIKCEVFKKIPQPWFMFEYYENGACKIGEDWFFCREAKKAGFKIWCDPTIKVGHIGHKIY